MTDSAQPPTDQIDEPVYLRLLRGAVDAHVHTLPFVNEGTLRSDPIELAQEAGSAGMKAIVVKSYFGSSCELAYLANRHGNGARVVGGVTLNRSVGGFNPDAVRVAAHLGADRGECPGRVVWMPERSSLHRARLLGLDLDEARYLSPFVAGDIDRGLSAEAEEVCRVIAEEDLVLATSHLGPEEGLALIELARALGCRRFVITHASNSGVAYSLEQKRRAAALGALIEEAAISWEPAMSLFHYRVADAQTEIFEAMRDVGPEHYVLASDCGFWFAPSPVDAMQVFIALLLTAGFSQEEIVQMSATNPSRLFRLDEKGTQGTSTRDQLGV